MKGVLTLDQFQNIVIPFKLWSGPYQTRILFETDFENWPYYLGGSGGYLKYNGEYFLVTNFHVVRDYVEPDRQNKIKALCVSQGSICAKLYDCKYSNFDDLAVFRVDRQMVHLFKGKDFLTAGFIDENPDKHLEDMCNTVLLHASPGENCELDYDSQVGELVTLPYMTQSIGEYSGMIMLSAEPIGIDETGNIVSVPNFNGMSGSWAYAYYDGLIPYKCIGVLTLGDKNAGKMYVIKIRDVLNFINKNFF